MSKVARNYLLIVLFSIVSVILIINWYTTGDPSRFFLLAYKLESTSENVDDIDVEFLDKKVYLNIRLKKPSTCKKVVAELGINNIIVGTKTYAPTCSSVDKSFLRITYRELKSV